MISVAMGGVILDVDLLPNGIAPGFTRLPDEDQEAFLSRVTHLHLQRQNIRQIGSLSAVHGLTVLYLYDNRYLIGRCLLRYCPSRPRHS